MGRFRSVLFMVLLNIEKFRIVATRLEHLGSRGLQKYFLNSFISMQ